jgi:polyferredoxin
LSAEKGPPYSRDMRTILLIVLILLLIGVFPGWGYSSGWGYYPFGGVGLILLIIIILALMGKL